MSIETLLEEVGPDGLRSAVERVLSDKVKEAPAKPEPDPKIVKANAAKIKLITGELETRLVSLIQILNAAHEELFELVALWKRARELASYAPEKISAWEVNKMAGIVSMIFGKIHNALVSLESSEDGDALRKKAKVGRVREGFNK